MSRVILPTQSNLSTARPLASRDVKGLAPRGRAPAVRVRAEQRDGQGERVRDLAVTAGVGALAAAACYHGGREAGVAVKLATDVLDITLREGAAPLVIGAHGFLGGAIEALAEFGPGPEWVGGAAGAFVMAKGATDLAHVIGAHAAARAIVDAHAIGLGALGGALAGGLLTEAARKAVSDKAMQPLFNTAATAATIGLMAGLVSSGAL